MPALAAGGTSPAPTGFQLTIPGGTATGSYYVIARANAGTPQIGESNSANNTKATSIHIGPPDLVVSSLSASTTSGTDLTTTITANDTTHDQIGNRPGRSHGDALLPLDRHDTRAPDDVSLGFRNVPALPPSGLERRLDLHVVPSGHGAGNLLRDREGERGQSDPRDRRTNNTRSIRIVIGPGSDRLRALRPRHRRSGSPDRRDRHDQEPGHRLGGAIDDQLLSVGQRDARRRRRLLGSRPVGILVPNGSDTRSDER